jgi:hypothetical protein
MKILLNSRQKVAIGVSALVIVGSWGFLALAPQSGTPVDVTQVPVPVPSEKPDTATPSASPTPDINEEYKRIDDLKAGAALDMGMALVAQVAAIDYKQSPEQVIQAIRPYASTTVLAQVGERFLAMNWADIEKRKYWLHAEVVNAEPLAPAGSTSNVPTKVRITVDLFEVNSKGDLNPMGRQIWEVDVGQGEGKNGWLATGLREVG